jgi:hypothetical protein
MLEAVHIGFQHGYPQILLMDSDARAKARAAPREAPEHAPSHARQQG